jgi:hypothetical protein
MRNKYGKYTEHIKKHTNILAIHKKDLTNTKLPKNGETNAIRKICGQNTEHVRTHVENIRKIYGKQNGTYTETRHNISKIWNKCIPNTEKTQCEKNIHKYGTHT